jgi:hypothetical protein
MSDLSWGADPFKSRCEVPGSVVVESPHNYLDNTEQYVPVEIKGAMEIEVAFDIR